MLLLYVLLLGFSCSAQKDPLGTAARSLSAFASAISATNEGQESGSFRENFNEKSPNSRTVFIPQDRKERLSKSILPFPPHFSQLPTTKSPPKQTVPEVPANPDYDYEYYYYYDEYPYFDNYSANPTDYKPGLGPLDPPLIEGTNTSISFAEPPLPPSSPSSITFSSASPSELVTAKSSARPISTTSTSTERVTNERTTRKPIFFERPTTVKLSLSDLVAQLKNKVGSEKLQENSLRSGRILRIDQDQPGNSDVSVRVTNSTESTVVVASVQMSHSATSRPPTLLKSTTPVSTNVQESLAILLGLSSERYNQDSVTVETNEYPTDAPIITDHESEKPRLGLETLFSHVDFRDLNGRPPRFESTTKKLSLDNFSVEVILKDILSYTPTQEEIPSSTASSASEAGSSILNLFSNVRTESPDKFLPPGYLETISNMTEDSEKEQLPNIVVLEDISKFLPANFKPKHDSEGESVLDDHALEEPSEKTHSATGLVFPKKPSRPSFLSTTTKKTMLPLNLPPVKPVITSFEERKKTTTEYTVPIITKKISKIEESSSTPSPSFSTTTANVPTTTKLPQPTTPGVCGSKCKLASTLRIVSGVDWQPALANRDTDEWQTLANSLEIELDSLYSRSYIAAFYDGIEIDSFHRGSVLVDYILQLNGVARDLDTVDLKHMLNSMLMEGSDYVLGNFSLDPRGTDFIVIPEQLRGIPEDTGGYLIPNWLVAVIVIGLASFLFILIFGITTLVSRTRVRKRHTMPLREEFLNNLNVANYVGVQNNSVYDMDGTWNEKMAEKIMKPPSSRGRGYNPEYDTNMYDSWRTDCSGPYSSSATYYKRPPLNF